jgi:ArsR family transcriptional regulator, lead/cadmium/zinc/bismuth-responsive transcriptional repressor
MIMLDNQQPTHGLRCEESFIHEDQVLIAQEHLIDGLTSTHLARTFQALSDPTRVRLISALTNAELCVCDLAAVLGMSQSAVSHQLRSLRDLRLVKSRRLGREIFYTLDDDHIRELYELGLKHIQHG